MSRIAEPRIVVSDGGPGFQKALKKSGQMTDCSAAYFMYFARYDVTPCSPVILYLGSIWAAG